VRAAFVAIADPQQVAVLCPTTLLAEQHLQTFADRFADWPVRIAERRVSGAPRKRARSSSSSPRRKWTSSIGTHKLLARDMKFSALGLVIIDEEHRFGVRHKER